MWIICLVPFYQASEVALPGESEGILRIINAAPCAVNVQSLFYEGGIPFGMVGQQKLNKCFAQLHMNSELGRFVAGLYVC